MPPIRENYHPLYMRNFNVGSEQGGVRLWLLLMRFALTLALVILLCGASAAPEAARVDDPVQPLPQDSGTAGLQEMLLRLGTTARLMQVVAHPDDEDGGMLTLESRGKGATVLLQTLNRGEGGQNKIGSNLFDVLGVLRTLEVTAADRYYGIEQRFTRVADFGFSKTPDETFQKWQGHDIALGDLVRVIRTFRPDVLVARFSGTERDGHGHHQASSILTREAFRAAADPERFPEQIKEGLQPWQAKKFYIGNVCGFGALTCADQNYTVKLSTGEQSSALGMTYIQFAMQGLKHQLSQGAGGWSIDSGPHYAFYKLADSVLPPAADKGAREQDFFDGIDTSLPELAMRMGREAIRAPLLRPALVEIQGDIAAAKAAAGHDPGSAAGPLLAGLEATRRTMELLKSYPLTEATEAELQVELSTKADQLEKAANLALGVGFHVNADVPAGENADSAFMAVRGQSFEVTARFSSQEKVELKEVALDLPPGWTATKRRSGAATTFRVTVAKDANYTRPYWHRDDPERDAINRIDDPRYVTLPFPPPALQAHANYTLNGEPGVARAVVMVRYKEPPLGEVERALAVAPAFSVMLEPGAQVIPTHGDAVCRVKVAVSSNLPGIAQGTLRVEVPAGWRAEPASAALKFGERGEKQEAEFKVFHDGLTESRTEIRAVFEAGASKYSEGYSVVTREDLNTFYYYQPAVQRVSVVDVKVPAGLKVGYIMGAGDDIPTVLQQIGMDVTAIAAEKLASEDLSRYGTIVLGIRAYDTQKDVADNNKKLLDYVFSGGTLIVQYNASAADFNKGNFTPYHAQISRARVTVEEAPVEILAPGDGVFHFPNEITARDFDGWVQERGLYFMDQWASAFTPLLSCHDPGEPEQKGGLLRAKYGKGTYIYTGYAFFRQLPAGVPGAIRLYVNLLAAK
ncbi:MAG: PIG-L family deacetylase [Terriglobales bacterium]